MQRYTVDFSPNSHVLQFERVQLLVSSVTLTLEFPAGGEQQHWLIEEVEMLAEGKSSLKIQHPSGAYIVITDPVLIATLQKHARLYRRSPIGISVVYVSMIMRFIGFLILAALLIWFFFRSVVPWLADRGARSFSKEYEIQLGEQMFANMKKGLQIDEARSATLNAFYKELGYRIDYPVKLYVVNEPVINAFAVPGGNVVVYHGILNEMQTPEELAALLGHEVSHITLRHSLRGIFRQLAGSIWWQTLTGADAGLIGIVAGQANELQQLSYSRNLETAADENGIALMYANNINTRGMRDLITLLSKEEGNARAINFLSTHPIADVRIEQVNNFLDKYPPKPSEHPALDSLFKELKIDNGQ